VAGNNRTHKRLISCSRDRTCKGRQFDPHRCGVLVDVLPQMYRLSDVVAEEGKLSRGITKKSSAVAEPPLLAVTLPVKSTHM